MKFLLIIRERPMGPPPEDPMKLNREVRAWVSQNIEEGVLECAYYMLPKAGMCIVNAPSHESLLSLMRRWPAYLYSTFEVHVLANLSHGIDDNYDRMASQGESK